MFNDDLFSSIPFSAEIAPQKFLQQRKSHSQHASKPQNLYSDAELEKLKRALTETDRRIAKYNQKIAEYESTRVLVGDLIRDLNVVSSDLQNEPDLNVSVPHILDITSLRKSILAIIQIHESLDERFTSTFEKKATDLTQRIANTQTEINDVMTKIKDANQEIKHLERQSEILRKEKSSLLSFLESKKAELNLKEKAVLSEIQEEMIETDHVLKKKRSQVKKKSIFREKPLPKFLRTGPEDETEYIHKETAIIESQAEKDRLELDNLRNEANHLKSEIKRAKRFLRDLKTSLNSSELAQADQEASEIRKAIEDERNASKERVLRQIKRNKELQRKLTELVAEESEIKGHLAQAERQLVAQLNSLPVLGKRHRPPQNSSP